MPISRASFGLITQLLDAGTPRGEERRFSSLAWTAALRQVAVLGAGALGEEVTQGDDSTIQRFLQLQRLASAQGLETFLRLRDLTDDALEVLRQVAAEVAAKVAPGEKGPPGLRPMVDLGQPDEADLERWLAHPREGSVPGSEELGPGGNWSQALAFSVFAPDGETAVRRLERIAPPLLEAAQRPGIEQPVWLAAFGVDRTGAMGDPDGVIQVATHALSLGIERVFLAHGPISGWWPDHLRSPSASLQAFRTVSQRLDGATQITRLAPGQYQISLPNQPHRFVLWKTAETSRLPAGLHGPLEVTTALGDTRRVEAARLKLTAEPLFADCLE